MAVSSPASDVTELAEPSWPNRAGGAHATYHSFVPHASSPHEAADSYVAGSAAPSDRMGGMFDAARTHLS